MDKKIRDLEPYPNQYKDLKERFEKLNTEHNILTALKTNITSRLQDTEKTLKEAEGERDRARTIAVSADTLGKEAMELRMQLEAVEIEKKSLALEVIQLKTAIGSGGGGSGGGGSGGGSGGSGGSKPTELKSPLGTLSEDGAPPPPAQPPAPPAEPVEVVEGKLKASEDIKTELEKLRVECAELLRVKESQMKQLLEYQSKASSANQTITMLKRGSIMGMQGGIPGFSGGAPVAPNAPGMDGVPMAPAAPDAPGAPGTVHRIARSPARPTPLF